MSENEHDRISEGLLGHGRNPRPGYREKGLPGHGQSPRPETKTPLPADEHAGLLPQGKNPRPGPTGKKDG